MGLIVLDSGVMIALMERTDTHHSFAVTAVEAARERGDRFALPASAYAEILVRPARRGPGEVSAVDGIVDAMPSAVVPIDRTIAAKAAQLRARHGRALRLPDALVLAAADVLRADRLLTTDAELQGRGVEVDLIQAS